MVSVLPEYITAIKTLTYDTQQIRDGWEGIDGGTITDGEILDLIQEWAYDNLGDGFRLVDPETMEELA